jgi:hypothetical protein
VARARTLFFRKSRKNPKKRTLSRCRRLNFRFHAKQITPGFLEFVSLQNETKMKKIGDYDPFFDFFIFPSKRWLGTKKKITIPKYVAIFKRGNFLKYWKKLEHFSYKELREKTSFANRINFFFCLIMEKCKLLNPRYARCARYAWGKIENKYEQNQKKNLIFPNSCKSEKNKQKSK